MDTSSAKLFNRGWLLKPPHHTLSCRLRWCSTTRLILACSAELHARQLLSVWHHVHMSIDMEQQPNAGVSNVRNAFRW